MNVEIGAKAALFPEKEYISGIFVAVCISKFSLSFPKEISSLNFPYLFQKSLESLATYWVTNSIYMNAGRWWLSELGMRCLASI
jgi:hypothetical protein